MQHSANYQRRLAEGSALFLKTDLDVGLTMIRIAGQSKVGSAKRERNIKKSRLVYDTVLRFLPVARLEQEDSLLVNEKLAELRAALEELGERF